ncbi:response regulator transcription factor [Desulforhopalus singaporensis]|uniref:DNA-binding response regulator, OmpR family, contains REC and winged-helix (WHTH) domain n=1 Tax=Desulforhopalus singaporensis TaxID=91360 RepID=A0A1H0STU4_9BACT|nr:response regulator transcription factor [Desulforhopalus singaporensis]SDP45090.1 DNA-binding response regulator, OmpR family, contains REC and winged-helix (wHTH) domain [Desulforhopalus singaporensis]
MIPEDGPVVIIEDDYNTAALVRTYLEREGFSTVHAADGVSGLELVKERRPIFVVLDIMLPGLDGWEICRRLRTFSDVPLLMLTAREEEIDRVKGLAIGADDYVIKPFSPRELVERVKAILRRARPSEELKKRKLTCNRLEMDLERHRVRRGGKTIPLTTTEFRLLKTLMQSPGRVFSRNELLDSLYQHGEIVVDRVIDVHIGKLRQKLEDNPARPKYILTARGFGYSLCDEDDP